MARKTIKNKKTESNEAKKQDSTVKAVVYFVVAIIVVFGLVVAIRYFPQKAKQQLKDYNGFLFENIAGLWFTQIQKDQIIYQVSLHFAPWELDDVYIQGEPKIFLELMQKYNLSAVYVTMAPEANDNPYVALAYAELKMNLERAMQIKPILACTENRTEACSNRTMINPNIECSKRQSMIILLESDDNLQNLPEIQEKTNCYRIKGSAKSADEMGIVKAADKFVYSMYGIVKSS